MNYSTARLWVLAVATAVALLSLAAVVDAVTIVVEEDDLQPPGSASGWVRAMQSSTAAAPVGEFWNALPQGDRPPETTSGAFHFLTELRTGSDPLQKIYLGTNNHSGVKLADITSFKYYTYVHSRRYEFTGQPCGQPPIIEIITDIPKPGEYDVWQQRRFVYKPWGWWGGHHVAYDTWQEWDLMQPGSYINPPPGGEPHDHWELLYVDTTNCRGDWNWVVNRYPQPGNPQNPHRLATPYVGDYTQGYDASWRLGNQSGTSMSIRVGSGSTWYQLNWSPPRAFWNPETQNWLPSWAWWRESCAIDAYADRLVIGINGVETVYDFGGSAATVGIRPGSARDGIIANAKKNYFFVAFGRVMDNPTSTQFFLDDGGGKKLPVLTPDGNSVRAGEFWRARGTLVWNTDTGRYDLHSSVYDIIPVYIPGP